MATTGQEQGVQVLRQRVRDGPILNRDAQNLARDVHPFLARRPSLNDLNIGLLVQANSR
jgi:hypothetical protein